MQNVQKVTSYPDLHRFLAQMYRYVKFMTRFCYQYDMQMWMKVDAYLAYFHFRTYIKFEQNWKSIIDIS